MKKTLFLTTILSLVAAHAYAADDVFVPQSVISVQQGEKVTSSTPLTDAAIEYATSTTTENTTVGEVLGQAQQFTKNYSKRSAIVKDGQGTLVVNEDAAMKAPLLVREGTLVIKNATITNTPKSDGNNLSVSGVNAELVLDGGHYTQPLPPAVSYSSSVSIGAIDGDGTLTLRNGSSFFTVQTIFTGGSSNIPMRDAVDPAWNVNPHSGGSYASVDTDPSSADTIGAGNMYYRHSVNDAGFENPFTSPSGSRLSTATVNVLSGSILASGTGFYVYNTTLNIDGEGSTVQTGTRNNSDGVYIGSSYGTLSVVNITNGGKFETHNNQFVCLSYYDGQQTELNVSGAGSELICTHKAYVGSNTGRTDVRLTDGGRISFGTDYAMKGKTGSHRMLIDGEGTTFAVGGTWQIGGAEVVISNGASADVTNWRVIDASSLSLMSGAEMFAIDGELSKGATTIVDKGSTLYVLDNRITSGASLVNRGILSHYAVDGSGIESTTYLYGGSRLQTGEALISGCENLVAEGHDMKAEYTTGLGELMSLKYATARGVSADKGTITLGALLTGKEEMQYLSSDDMQKINEAVFEGLALGENAAYTIVYKHEIGKNITVNYTTDHLNHVTGTESVAVNGGAILVEQGEGDHHVGTIGSYVEHAGETAAAVAVGETETGSHVTWQGDGMTTVSGENTKLISGTNVSIGEVAGEGTLTVVADSTLDNNGVINAKAVVEQGGTLKGSGSLGATEVQGTLVVGNSPGAPTFAGDLTLYSGSETVFSIAGLDTPATATLNGWESATYSQITITDGGSLTLENGACFTIEFGGALLSEIGGCQDFSFDLTLVNAGEGAITLGDAALTLLLDNTDFLISPDALAGVEGWSVEFDRSNMAYSVQANGSELHLVGTARLVPEPATATLSLLALAALATRRKRK